MATLRPSPLNQRTLSGLAILLVLIWAVYQATSTQDVLFNPGGLPQLLQFFRASLHPDLSHEFLQIILRATWVTFAYAVCGTGLSLAWGFIGGLLCSEIWWQTLLPHQRWCRQLMWLTIRGLLAWPRAIHELIWGLFLVNIFGLDPLVGVVAIAVPFSAIVAKVFSEILDETDHTPLQAILSSGVAPLSAIFYGLLPQALPNLLSYSFYRFECSLRAATVLGIIGAGGLGYEVFLSLQSLRYEQLWTGFYALILLNGGVDLWSAQVRKRLGFVGRLQLVSTAKTRQTVLGDDLTSPQYRTVATNPALDPETKALAGQSQGRQNPKLRLSKAKVAKISFTLVPFSLTVPFCFWSLQISWSQLWSVRTLSRLKDVLVAAKPESLTWGQVNLLASLSLQTIAMSVLAIGLAGASGILFSFLAAQNLWLPGGVLQPTGQWWGTGVVLVSRLGLLVSRAIPAPIWALVCLFVIFPGIWPGAIALALHNFGILGRLMAEANENLNEDPIKAIRAVGATRLQTILYGLLPQNLSGFLAYILYRWEVCLRETVIVGLVGAGGLGRLMTEQLSSFDYADLTLTLVSFILLTFGIDLISAKLRGALR